MAKTVAQVKDDLLTHIEAQGVTALELYCWQRAKGMAALAKEECDECGLKESDYGPWQEWAFQIEAEDEDRVESLLASERDEVTAAMVELYGPCPD